ncbi:CD209 antigen-like protein E isoform X4 [Biomphalaria glabrata]|uniref:CD209 antigen-like protein E isoform X4 n=1 Tax=Biomphalaria glabrata TaxID=6526 RepID=A0A9W3BE48_BIOGL|nr:CD209 antigen-like protein E isoform X4 [Biomphalaria glabrata]
MGLRLSKNRFKKSQNKAFENTSIAETNARHASSQTVDLSHTYVWAARSVQMKTTLARLTAMCRLKSNFTLYTFENKTKCLWFNDFRDTFQQAKSRCEDVGAYLAVIKSYKEYVIFSTNKRNEWTWIGLDDIQKEGVYMWQDGSRARQFPYVHFSNPNDGGRDYVLLQERISEQKLWMIQECYDIAKYFSSITRLALLTAFASFVCSKAIYCCIFFIFRTLSNI